MNNPGRLTDEAIACLPALRIVAVSLLISLLWKFRVFGLAVEIYRSLPVVDDFFPQALQSTNLMIAAYFIALVSVGYLVVGSRPGWMSVSALAALLALGVLCLHQQSYNDVTFLTCWWTALWCWWFIRQLGQPAESLMVRAAFLSHLILSVIFLGGAVGKLTPGYWSGEVFYGIYFEGRDYWLFNLMRRLFAEDQLSVISCWYSRTVIALEALCAFLWLMPVRLASIFAILVLCNIALMNNTLLFSVVTCLIGLALAGLHQPVASVTQSAVSAAVKPVS